MTDRQENNRRETPEDLSQSQPQALTQSHSRNDENIRCEEIETLAVLYACDELDAAARTQLEAHFAHCTACADAVSRELRLQQVIAALDQPADSLDRSGLLLAQCRSELAESLDDKEARSNRTSPSWTQIFSPVSWWGALRHTLIYHPAMSMTVLVVAGFLAGVAGQRLPLAPVPVPAVATHSTTTTASVKSAPAAAAKVTDEQLRRVDNAHVAWVTPSSSGNPTVQVQLMSPTPMDIVGAPDDADVQRALTFLIENGQRFDPNVRLDSLDVLRMNAGDPEVRRTLCAAARLDRNPAVRIKALEALQGFEGDPRVREALLDALEIDSNSGVRDAAIRLLRTALQSEGESVASNGLDAQTVDVLRDRLRNDPSPSVRQQSAAALHELGIQ
ncbi:MAG TPA: HEAT repeat domain-containing protein [Candidatus Acidoferrales bacterium]|nr:HEAT repeat domain-containing protein [Candidatus Acidoferrales bacterium]